MGVVYLARDPRLDRRVAIKGLAGLATSGGAFEESHLARLQREARVLASLNHPNIVTIFGIESEGDSPYLVMEYVEGPELGERMSAALELREALAVCAQVATAVEAAHDAGIVHRDLKPANIRIGQGGRVKVLDFGLAREASRGAAPGLNAAQRDAATISIGLHTQQGMILGTPGYMSPEQARGEAIDKRTDVFSLACVVFECLTGRRAFAGRTTADVIAATLTAQPDLALVPASIPGGLRDALRAALEKESNLRSASVSPLRRELEAALVALSASSVSAERIAPVAPPSERPPALKVAPRPRPSTTLIGRAEDVAKLRTALGSHRLVSVVGAPGSGKSRVAGEVASALVEAGKRTPGPVAFVDGEGLPNVPALMHAVLKGVCGDAAPVGGPAAALARAAEHGLTVVIDECDHTRESLMMVVHAVLNAGPRARVLVSSRDPLNLPDEHVHRLGSLAVPRDDAPPNEATLASHDATLLFVARAQASWPDFDLSERSCRDVIRVTRRLGGVPMAIELAAARARLLGMDRLLHTLEEALRPAAKETGGVLTRHAVVRVAVDWSISILSPREQLRLRQLASLLGGFTLEEARHACGDSSHGSSAAARDAVSALESLCEKHLVTLGVNTRGDECYAMHALVRDAALRQPQR